MISGTILAIESAISGGSLALLDDGRIVDKWTGSGEKSRSEQLLPRVSEMLDRNGLRVRDISAVAVSNGPGSYTGTRIGLATATGLACSLEIACVGVSVLTAIAQGYEGSRERIVAVPIGRGGYCWQYFREASDNTGAVSGNLGELRHLLGRHPEADVLMHSDAYHHVTAALDGKGSRTVDIGRDLAVYVGRRAARADDGLEPFYVREAVSSSVGVAPHRDPRT